MTLGRVFKEMENAALAWGTDGVELTDAETIANTNTTLVTSDTPWNVARHTYLLSVAATRLALCAAYVLVDFKRSITSPNQVRVLSLSPLTRRVTHLKTTASASCCCRHYHRLCLALPLPCPAPAAAQPAPAAVAATLTSNLQLHTPPICLTSAQSYGTQPVALSVGRRSRSTDQVRLLSYNNKDPTTSRRRARARTRRPTT